MLSHPFSHRTSLFVVTMSEDHVLTTTLHEIAHRSVVLPQGPQVFLEISLQGLNRWAR